MSRRHAQPGSEAHSFAVACAAAAVGGGTQSAIAEAQLRVRSWDEVLDYCWRNGVVPLVSSQLASTRFDGIPADVVRKFESRATAIAAQNLALTSALLEILASLQDAGVTAISYKGPVLAARGYGNLALRHFNDLDVLVRQGDLASAAGALMGIGYSRHDPVGAVAEEATRRWGHHISFLRDKVLLEMHWRFHKPLFGRSFPEEGIWHRVETFDLAGRRVQTLSLTDELLVLATHASWHGWAQLSWVCDFAAVAGRTTPAQASVLLTAATEHGCIRPVLLAFQLTHELLGAEPPARVASLLREHSVVRRASSIVCRRLANGTGPDTEGARLQLALRERQRDKFAFAMRALFQPNPADIRAVPLPAGLFPLYYVIRPIRITFRYRPRLAG